MYILPNFQEFLDVKTKNTNTKPNKGLKKKLKMAINSSTSDRTCRKG